jgi:hypothetical protein
LFRCEEGRALSATYDSAVRAARDMQTCDTVTASMKSAYTIRTWTATGASACCLSNLLRANTGCKRHITTVDWIASMYIYREVIMFTFKVFKGTTSGGLAFTYVY